MTRISQNFEYVSEEYFIQFDKSNNNIDIDTLGPYLLEFSDCIQHLRRLTGIENELEIKIETLEPGSFKIKINLGTLIDKLNLLYTSKNTSKITELINTLVGISSLVLMLQGGEPSNVIQQNNGNVTVVKDSKEITVDNRTYNIYVNEPKVAEAIIEKNKILANDEEIKGYKILDSTGKEQLKFDRQDIIDSSIERETKTENIKWELAEANLIVVRISFDKKLVSTFNYRGQDISATIKDEKFYKLVHSGAKFGIGDVLTVILRKKWVFDPRIGVFKIKGYEIVELISINPNEYASQLDLFK